MVRTFSPLSQTVILFFFFYFRSLKKCKLANIIHVCITHLAKLTFNLAFTFIHKQELKINEHLLSLLLQESTYFFGFSRFSAWTQMFSTMRDRTELSAAPTYSWDMSCVRAAELGAHAHCLQPSWRSSQLGWAWFELLFELGSGWNRLHQDTMFFCWSKCGGKSQWIGDLLPGKMVRLDI